MPRPIRLSVDRPCGENYHTFDKNAWGGYCRSCQKEIVDFTAMSDRELYAYFKDRPGQACGRFRAEQLGAVAPPVVRRRAWWRPAALLSLLPLSLPVAAVAQSVARTEATGRSASHEEPQPTLEPSDTATFTGRITDGRHPIGGARVNAAAPGVTCLTDADGYFRLVVPPGVPPTIRVSSLGYLDAVRTVERTGPVDLGSISMSPAIQVEVEPYRADVHVTGGYTIADTTRRWWLPGGAVDRIKKQLR
ncbi:MAG: carboxypeptidase regulatory-like domain-containing protein [Catalinimonas sp.]